MITEIENKQKVLFQVALNLGVDLIVLFGSRADGSSRPNSDFDIAYRSKTPLESEEDHDLFTALMAYTGSENLHIVNIRNIKPLFFYEIMRNCKVLYAENMENFYSLRAYAFRRFEDEVKPLYKIKFDRLKAEYL